ncbi:MAG: acetyl-coenzyme A carboxylase carboxyl transferase subunit beta [Micavibrio sp.]|nr:MAG: acetyl-coenzyme A carboxylase carboxyl transferase subunit beta [Micavibrio sp.]
MNWLTNLIRPRIRSLVEPKDVPDNLWQKCAGCEGMLFHRDLLENMNVCYHCGHHLRISVKDRLEMMFDNGAYDKIDLPDVPHDPLKFKDRRKYADRIKDSRAKTGLKDAITIAKGTMGGIPVVIAAFNFSFMGGSMGAAVGEAILKAAEEAVKSRAALITVPASGGARMQEGMLSLVQMPRSIIAVEMVKDAGLPYVVLLTDPTTGGVSASFAMVGDIHIAEPGSMIGFAGRRVIEETVRETLPDDFQTAEYLLEHGIVDMVVKRQELKDTITNVLSMLMKKPQPEKKAKNGNGNGKKSGKGGNPKTNGKAPPASGEKASIDMEKDVQAARALGQVKAAQKAARRISKPPQKSAAKKASNS